GPARGDALERIRQRVEELAAANGPDRLEGRQGDWRDLPRSSCLWKPRALGLLKNREPLSSRCEAAFRIRVQQPLNKSSKRPPEPLLADLLVKLSLACSEKVVAQAPMERALPALVENHSQGVEVGSGIRPRALKDFRREVAWR